MEISKHTLWQKISETISSKQLGCLLCLLCLGPMGIFLRIAAMLMNKYKKIQDKTIDQLRMTSNSLLSLYIALNIKEDALPWSLLGETSLIKLPLSKYFVTPNCSSRNKEFEKRRPSSKDSTQRPQIAVKGNPSQHVSRCWKPRNLCTLASRHFEK